MEKENTLTDNPSSQEAVVVEMAAEPSASVDGALSKGMDLGSQVGEASGSQGIEGSSEKSLEFADELMEKGREAIRSDDFVEAVDCLSRALEIRVQHYGELAPKCAMSYYHYGRALLYKAQEESDPLNVSVTMAKKAASSSGPGKMDIDLSKGKGVANGEASTASDGLKDSSNKGKESEGSNGNEENDDESSEDDGDGVEDDQGVDGTEEEEESDLDLSWKMLDIARVIIEKNPVDTLEKVDVISTLGDVSLEREDFETSLGDYFKALSILESLVEKDNRQLAELNFKICLAMQLADRPADAVKYCKKSMSVCEARLQRLTSEVSESTAKTTSVDNESFSVALEEDITKSSEGNDSNTSSVQEKNSEIETLKMLLVDLKEKLEDLQQMMSSLTNPLIQATEKLISTIAEKAKEDSSMSSRMGTETCGFDSPKLTTITTTTKSTEVTHLGVVGRGVKRASAVQVMELENSEKGPSLGSSVENFDNSGDISEKKPCTDSSMENSDKNGDISQNKLCMDSSMENSKKSCDMLEKKPCVDSSIENSEKSNAAPEVLGAGNQVTETGSPVTETIDG